MSPEDALDRHCRDVEGDSIISLGMNFDKHLLLVNQVNRTIRTYNFNIPNIGRIRRFISEDACKTLVQALVMSRLDYANALYILVGLPQCMLHRLQLVQHSAACLITNKKEESQHLLAGILTPPVCDHRRN